MRRMVCCLYFKAYRLFVKPCSNGDLTEKRNLSIGEEKFLDIDPGVFDNEMVKLADGDVTKGTYTGTQAALTHAYARIERRLEFLVSHFFLKLAFPNATEAY